MSKLYVFCIGGTGSRVLRSLTMLLAAGVDCDVDTIVPIIIDRDKGNGDFTRTESLIKNYIAIDKIAPKNDKKKNIENRFFNTKIKLLNNELLLKLDDQKNKFSEFIGLSTQNDENKALSKILFSKRTLAMDTDLGFRGNPNIGSVVLNQFDDKNVFKAFAADFQDGDKIFIISSIFGGTGASGFPLLRKMLQTPNVNDASGVHLPNWGLVNSAPIGAISVLPYFSVDRKGNVDSDTFNDKTHAALSYYETENGKVDTFYYIADTQRKTYKYCEGGAEQKNDAHFVELSSALAILDFANKEKRLENFQLDNYGKRKTVYKEFGINSDVTEIGFNNLAAETQKLLVNPLSRFLLFAKYMGYTIVKKTEKGKDILVASHADDKDIFKKECKYQPYAKKRFTGDFRNELGDLETMQKLYLEWLLEMTQQTRKFSPFNLTSPDAFNFVNGKINLFSKSGFSYRNWAKVDNELNKQISKTNSSLENKGKFIELFYRTSKALINQTTQNSGEGDGKFIFRLQTDGDFGLRNTIEHWDVSDLYGEKQRNAITSSNKKSLNQPSSIPSPFARIALVKTAFAEVAAKGESALAAYQKIVSDSLDVAEIFFTLEKWRDKVEIITWKYGRKDNGNNFALEDDSDLKKLNKGHIQLFNTYSTFLKDDELTYNFDKMKSIFILKYINTGDIIGATSPCTLFFSTANHCDNIDIQLNNQHKAFEGIVPLSKRNWDFQKFLYSWIVEYNEIRSIGNVSISVFKEFVSYLEAQKPIINRTEELDKLREVDRNDFFKLRAPDVEILGKPLFQSKSITPNRWAVDDIFEDKIIRLPYEVNKGSFFDGNLPEKSKETFLLPIKENFFQPYTTADLMKFIKINQSGNVVDVELNIEGREYQKRYTSAEGNLIDLTFDCAIFPNARFENENLAHYRFGLVCDFKDKDKFSTKFIKRNSSIETQKTRFSVRNETEAKNYQLKNYSLEGSNFDYIEVHYNQSRGILIPKLPPVTGKEEFTFSIDFGTTNTHIEYKLNDERTIRTFEILGGPIDEKQVHWLHGKEDYIKEVFDEEYIPAYTDEEFRFPMRTALSYGENTNWNDVYPFEKASLNELYEKRLGYPYNKTETDLKWSEDENYKKQVEVYIKSLMYLIRNKVIINNGKLEKTKIRWFYPVSMERQRFENLSRAWEVAYEKFFNGDKGNILSITESIAPFEYYVKDRDANNLVTIDIGGGTTDIVISMGGEVDYITSFRFAANSIFGDGYAENDRIKNGIIRQFIDEIKSELQTSINQADELFQIFDHMYSKKSSSDIASFLFSLQTNKKVRSAGENLAQNTNLSKKLIDDSTQKITFIFFFAAIIYHLAKLMQAKDLPMPDKIVFSGNGSRVIQFFSDDDDILKTFAMKIFEKVNGKNYAGDLTIIRNKENPKEATCKGGFFVETPLSYIDVLKKKVVLHSNGTNNVINRSSDSSDECTESNTYECIDDQYLTHTVKEAEKFIQFVFDLLPFFNNQGYQLNSTSIDLAKKVCSKKLEIHTKNGWLLKKKEISKDEIIDETLFFYPLVGMFKDLTDAICDENLKKLT